MRVYVQAGVMADFSSHDGVLGRGFYSSVRLYRGEKELTFSVEDVMVCTFHTPSECVRLRRGTKLTRETPNVWIHVCS